MNESLTHFLTRVHESVGPVTRLRIQDALRTGIVPDELLRKLADVEGFPEAREYRNEARTRGGDPI